MRAGTHPSHTYSERYGARSPWLVERWRVVIYLISWWMLFLGSLPLKVRGQFEDGDVVEGSEPGAPITPRIKEKMWLAAVLAAGVWLVLFCILEFGLISLDALPWGPQFVEYE